ncbi:hypothetical protein FB470_001918 [Amycolatopsis thermophila]|uniref:Uncharacterized protein n=1 Tax=Amycolatopsis thermophila TaxID=206084 RepID=A0ABU0ERL2_9PSEU|nr:hypothetical protein [Amycolatopsis thermophila]
MSADIAALMPLPLRLAGLVVLLAVLGLSIRWGHR